MLAICRLLSPKLAMLCVQRITLLSLGRHPRRSLFAALILGIGCLLVVSSPASSAAEDQVVELTIDYGDGVQKRFTALAWKEKMTVYDALKQASQHRRGIKETHTGSGESLLVTSIDDLKNVGVGRNWLFEVNGAKADRSSGVYSLKAGDAVLWRFGKQK
jgi:hypothetical protein